MFFVWLNLSLSNPPILKPILLSFMRNKRKMEIGLFYDERQFMENLFCTRLNYFFIIFSLILMAAVTVRSNTNLILVLFIGLIIQLLLWFSVNRIYVKLDIVLKILHNLDEHHVFSITDKCLKKRRHYFFQCCFSSRYMASSFVCYNMVHWIVFGCIRIYIFQLKDSFFRL